LRQAPSGPGDDDDDDDDDGSAPTPKTPAPTPPKAPSGPGDDDDDDDDGAPKDEKTTAPKECKDPGDKKCIVLDTGCCEIGDCDKGAHFGDLSCGKIGYFVKDLSCATVNKAKEYTMLDKFGGLKVEEGQFGGFGGDKCDDKFKHSNGKFKDGNVKIKLDDKGAASTPFALRLEDKSCYFFGFDKSELKCGKNVP
jgi:hypothetical protein